MHKKFELKDGAEKVNSKKGHTKTVALVSQFRAGIQLKFSTNPGTIGSLAK